MSDVRKFTRTISSIVFVDITPSWTTLERLSGVPTSTNRPSKRRPTSWVRGKQNTETGGVLGSDEMS